MKNTGIKMIAGSALIAFFAVNSFGQTTTTSSTKTTKTTTKSEKAAEKKREKLDKKRVPKEVAVVYLKDYPTITDESWYGYPTFDESAYWFGYDPYLYNNSSQEYYVAEFSKDGVPYTVIYSKTGRRIATHRALTAEVPAPVAAVVNNGVYKTWTVAREREEIFRDDNDMKVYKVVVEKGNEKHKLYIQSDGKLLKDIKVS